MTLPVVLRVLPAVLLSACCCCNLGSFIPDSVEDEIGKNIVEQGVGIATGSKVDIDNGRIDVTTADGERVMLGEGAGGVDPRMPVFGHPDCKVGGGMVMENGDGLNLTMAQEACAVPFDAMFRRGVGGKDPPRDSIWYRSPTNRAAYTHASWLGQHMTQ